MRNKMQHRRVGNTAPGRSAGWQTRFEAGPSAACDTKPDKQER